MAEGTVLPLGLHCESEPFLQGWRHVRNLDSTGMREIIERTGWRFFYIAGVIEMIAFGSDDKQTTAKVLRRIIASLKTRQFNCLEITQVERKRFLGMPYFKVSAHSRHIQAGLVLFSAQEPAPFVAPDSIAA